MKVVAHSHYVVLYSAKTPYQHQGKQAAVKSGFSFSGFLISRYEHNTIDVSYQLGYFAINYLMM